MIKKILVLLSLVFFCSIFAAAQVAPTNQNAGEFVARLPDSEVIMLVDAKRVFADALPLLTANNPAQAAEINRQIERFKVQTGIDAKDFDLMAAALDFSPKITSLFPPQGTLKLDPVVLARSNRSNAAQILAAARQAAARPSVGGKPLPIETRDKKYKGKEIFTVRIDDATRVFGLFDLKNREISIVALDEQTVAIGNLEAVRAAIEAFGGGKKVAASLVQLTLKNPNAAMSFAGIVPKYVSSRIKFGTPELSRPFRELRGFYGGLETAPDNFVLTTNLQTTGAATAAELSKTINLVKDFIPGLLAQLPAIFSQAAGIAVTSVESSSVSASGDEVQFV